MKSYSIHIKDAIALLESGKRVSLKVWKLKNGDVVEYHDVVCIGGHWRAGTHRIQLPSSSLIREFRDITLFEINGQKIYR